MKELRETCLMALWFIKSEEKRIALAKALASGKRSRIEAQAKKVLKSVRDSKTRKQLAALLFTLSNKEK